MSLPVANMISIAILRVYRLLNKSGIFQVCDVLVCRDQQFLMTLTGIWKPEHKVCHSLTSLLLVQSCAHGISPQDKCSSVNAWDTYRYSCMRQPPTSQDGRIQPAAFDALMHRAQGVTVENDVIIVNWFFAILFLFVFCFVLITKKGVAFW